jgi:hypothetical protein
MLKSSCQLLVRIFANSITVEIRESRRQVEMGIFHHNSEQGASDSVRSVKAEKPSNSLPPIFDTI